MLILAETSYSNQGSQCEIVGFSLNIRSKSRLLPRKHTQNPPATFFTRCARPREQRSKKQNRETVAQLQTDSETFSAQPRAWRANKKSRNTTFTWVFIFHALRPGPGAAQQKYAVWDLHAPAPFPCSKILILAETFDPNRGSKCDNVDFSWDIRSKSRFQVW